MFVVASMAGMLAMPGAHALAAGVTAGYFAIWAGIYEAAPTRRRAVVDLAALIGASALGAAVCAVWTSLFGTENAAVLLLPFAGGAFLVDYAKRYGTLATGAAAMAFLGQMIGFGLVLTARDLPMIAEAAVIALVAGAVLRVLGGPSERDADALSRCRDFRRVMAARLRRYHDALHHQNDGALARVVPRSGELTTAWAALDALVRVEFTDTDLIAGYLNAEIRHLYALLQTVLAIGDSLGELQASIPGLRDRAAIGLVLHTLRKAVMQDRQDVDPLLTASLTWRCERLVRSALGATRLSIDTRIAMLRIGLATRYGATADPLPVRATPTMPTSIPAAGIGMLATTRVAFQAGLSALAIIAVNSVYASNHVLWALVASTFVISSSVADTFSRGIRRMAGTAVGVALALGVALLFAQEPPVIWILAALAMVIYSVWLPLRYDVACGAYAFALVVILAAAGDSSWDEASARGLETVIGAAIGMAFAALVLPVRLRDQLAEMLATMLTAAHDQIAAAFAWTGQAARAARPLGEDSVDLLAEIATQKARFAGLRFEGILTRDGDGGALLLLRIDSLIETTMRLVGEARLAADHVDPCLADIVAGLDTTLGQAFDAVLARLRKRGRPAVPPSDAVLPALRGYMATAHPDAATTTGVLLAAALTYTSRKVIRTLADLAAELDRRDGFVTAPIAR